MPRIRQYTLDKVDLIGGWDNVLIAGTRAEEDKAAEGQRLGAYATSLHALSLSRRAKLVKLADKICNMLDVTHRPPKDWTLEGRREYLNWSGAVVAGCQGVNAAMEQNFKEVLTEGRARLAAG